MNIPEKSFDYCMEMIKLQIWLSVIFLIITIYYEVQTTCGLNFIIKRSRRFVFRCVLVMCLISIVSGLLAISKIIGILSHHISDSISSLSIYDPTVRSLVGLQMIFLITACINTVNFVWYKE